MMKITLTTVLALIFSQEIREKLLKALKAAPEYFWHIAASSSGKYHPKFDLGEGGTLRHSLLVAYFAHEGGLGWKLSQQELDLLVVAGLLHDLIKHGLEDCGHTVHEHPLLAAKFVRDLFPGDADMELVAQTIESHMGQWTTSKYSDVVLPLPETKMQLCISMADMIASRPVLGELGKPETWED